ncbi:MAG: alcohol dehydrogenase, partial [Anaerolineae bacterium]|nr:alcohol dehydrogenase [Anaerolineae bacterium]
MKTIRLHDIHDLRAHDENVPTTDDTFDTLLKVTSVGVCGSDLHWFEEGGIGDALPTFEVPRGELEP